ncbi:hypothetical protein B0H14DRAFT_2728378, partial [Mycena olivaceomarginata]
ALRTSRPDSWRSMSKPGFISSLPLPHISASVSKPRPALTLRTRQGRGSAVPPLVSSRVRSRRRQVLCVSSTQLEHTSPDIKYTFVPSRLRVLRRYVRLNQAIPFFLGGATRCPPTRAGSIGGSGMPTTSFLKKHESVPYPVSARQCSECASYRFSGNSLFSSRRHDRPCPGQGRTARNNGRGGKRRCLFSSRARASSADIMNVH